MREVVGEVRVNLNIIISRGRGGVEISFCLVRGEGAGAAAEF